MKKLVVLLAGLLAAGSVSAAPLSPAEALARVAGGGPNKVAAVNYVKNPVYTVRTDANQAAAYVFTTGDNKGFAILSADDVAFPVLGYSDTGTFDAENIPDNMKWWLSELSRQIEWAVSQGAGSASAPLAPDGLAAITPLMKTTWDQGTPYNDSCPTPKDGTQHAYTGCVATSMAQVMNYFKYPEHGTGTINYYASKLGVSISQDLAELKFDWDNMLDSYLPGTYNSAQAKAVADLMVACGYSVSMSYGLDASGASGFTIGRALRTYFDYDGDCRSEYRLLYSMSDWTQMIYDNLKNVGPVIINGRDPGDMGHSFVCDGYDGKGYFHFNWGWSGVSDGYYSLDALNPESMGIGGYGGGFNFGQNAIFGIQPKTGKPSSYKLNLTQLGNLTGEIVGGNFSASMADYTPRGYANYCDNIVEGSFGISFARIGSTASPVIVPALIGSKESVSVVPAYSTGTAPSSRVVAALPELENGEYKVTMMFKTTDGDWEEILVPWGYSNYVYLNRSNDSYTITRPEQKNLKIVDVEVASKFYYNTPILLKIKVENNSDVELTQGIVPRLLDGTTVVMTGSNSLLTVGPDQTVEHELIVKFSPADGYKFTSPSEFTLNISDPETNTSFGNFGTYTMESAPSTFSLTLKKLDIADAQVESVDYAGSTFNAYVVNKPSDFDVNFNFSVRAGYFSGYAKLSILQVDSEKASTLIPLTSADQIFQEALFMERGDNSENVVNVSFPEAEAGALYAIVARYTKASSWLNLGSPIYFVIDSSGVDGIGVEENEEKTEYYNLQGVKITDPQPGQVLIRRIGAKTDKVIVR
jgi:hypothetical protein